MTVDPYNITGLSEYDNYSDYDPAINKTIITTPASNDRGKIMTSYFDHTGDYGLSHPILCLLLLIIPDDLIRNSITGTINTYLKFILVKLPLCNLKYV